MFHLGVVVRTEVAILSLVLCIRYFRVFVITLPNGDCNHGIVL